MVMFLLRAWYWYGDVMGSLWGVPFYLHGSSKLPLTTLHPRVLKDVVPGIYDFRLRGVEWFSAAA